MINAKKKLLLLIFTGLGIILTSVTLFAFYNKNASETTIGKIIYVKKLNGVRLRGRLDEITYVYSVNGKDYACKQNIGVRFTQQAVGNRVRVEYKKKSPDESEAVAFYPDFKNSDNRVEFHASKKYGYHSIELINDLYYYTDYADSGYVLHKIVGTYDILDDTLVVTPFNHDIKTKYRTAKYVLVELNDRDNPYGIKNVSNNRVFE